MPYSYYQIITLVYVFSPLLFLIPEKTDNKPQSNALTMSVKTMSILLVETDFLFSADFFYCSVSRYDISILRFTMCVVTNLGTYEQQQFRTYILFTQARSYGIYIRYKGEAASNPNEFLTTMSFRSISPQAPVAGLEGGDGGDSQPYFVRSAIKRFQ